MKKLISINPANENIINQYDQYSEKEVQNIIIESSIAQSEWKEKSIDERIKVISEISNHLNVNLDLYAKLITLEMGKPIRESISEIKKCINLCEYYCTNCHDFFKPKSIVFH